LRSEEASSRLISEDEKKNYYLLYFWIYFSLSLI
jgi:hypothetical protein